MGDVYYALNHETKQAFLLGYGGWNLLVGLDGGQGFTFLDTSEEKHIIYTLIEKLDLGYHDSVMALKYLQTFGNCIEIVCETDGFTQSNEKSGESFEIVGEVFIGFYKNRFLLRVDK